MTKGLKALKRIALKDFVFNDDTCLEDIKTIEKELKALEIIKKRECVYKGLQEVTQEEYELLKEVLK